HRHAPGPMEAEVVVIQSKGMERWLSMELARRLGIWANARFPFPRKFIEDTLAAVLGGSPDGVARFSSEKMTWTIAALLPELTARPTFADLRSYLKGDDEAARRVELAATLAELFDQYPVYRPDWVLAWENGDDEGWQATLWRALVARNGNEHLARRAIDLENAA